jgi:magnesium transporter
LLTGIIIEQFEGMLSKMIILVMYMPMIGQTGGNAGSQAASVIISSLSQGQITSADWWKVSWKEARISLLLAVILGFIAFLKIMLVSFGVSLPEGIPLLKVAFVVCFALCLQVISATLIGSSIPLLIKLSYLFSIIIYICTNKLTLHRLKFLSL